MHRFRRVLWTTRRADLPWPFLALGSSAPDHHLPHRAHSARRGEGGCAALHGAPATLSDARRVPDSGRRARADEGRGLLPVPQASMARGCPHVRRGRYHGHRARRLPLRDLQGEIASIPWFAWCYARFEAAHVWARAQVAPIKAHIHQALVEAGLLGRRAGIIAKLVALWRYERRRRRGPTAA